VAVHEKITLSQEGNHERTDEQTLRALTTLGTQAIDHRKKKILSKSQKGVTSDNGGLLR